MRHSDSFGKVAAALAKAQGAIQQPAKNKTASVQTRTGGTYKFSYADLSAMIEACHKALAENGLAFVCAPGLDQAGADVLDARVVHAESGEWLGATFPMKLDGTPQECGSAITYGRRYCLMMLCNMAADDDDDGNGASGNSASIADRRPPMRQPTNGNGSSAPTNGGPKPPTNGQPAAPQQPQASPSNMEKMAGALGVNADGTISDEQISAACNDYRRRNGVDASEVRAVIKSVTGCDRVRDVPQEKRKSLMQALAKTIALQAPQQQEQPAGAAA